MYMAPSYMTDGALSINVSKSDNFIPWSWIISLKDAEKTGISFVALFRESLFNTE